jgi:hypothetical protein
VHRLDLGGTGVRLCFHWEFPSGGRVDSACWIDWIDLLGFRIVIRLGAAVIMAID